MKNCILAILVAAVTVSAQPSSPRPPPLRVLFIGNSLTTSNDLPDVVARLAEAGGRPRPHTRTVAVGGFSLEDHWQQGNALRAINQGRWDVVVLQQGPSALLESRQLLIAYARRFAAAIRATGAKPALYMVWPSLSRQQDFAGVSLSYRAAASDVGGLLLPVGEAWRAVLQRHRDLALYSEDQLHPTFAGTYLAALVIHSQLYGDSAVALPALQLSDSDARRLQEAVRLPEWRR